MNNTRNITSDIAQQLPPELVVFLRQSGNIAQKQEYRLYLVGGVVRDLLLNRPTHDIDLAVEGDVMSFISSLSDIEPGTIVRHERFGTARLVWQDWTIDFATTRQETYPHPGALPMVTPSTIQNDLIRRDFTVNAMAVHLNPDLYGNIIDLYGGIRDIENKTIRILHDNSFVDDATRIWRAIRYEQRLDFHIEPYTLQLLEKNLPMLDTVSGDRIRYELECVLKEALPEKALRRADGLGVLAKMHPDLHTDEWLAEKFGKARGMANHPLMGIYLALLVYRLSAPAVETIITFLNFPNAIARIAIDSIGLKSQIPLLADPVLSPSQIYRLLDGHAMYALLANAVATEDPVAFQHIQDYLNTLRYVRPVLNGHDLIRLGVEPGPRFTEILERLRDARLDGKIETREEAEKLVRLWTTNS